MAIVYHWLQQTAFKIEHFF